MTTAKPADAAERFRSTIARIARLFAAYSMRDTTQFRIVVARYADGRRRGAVQVACDHVAREGDYLEGAAAITMYRHHDLSPAHALRWESTMPTGVFSDAMTDDEVLAVLERSLADATRLRAADYRAIAARRVAEAEAMERALAAASRERNFEARTVAA